MSNELLGYPKSDWKAAGVIGAVLIAIFLFGYVACSGPDAEPKRRKAAQTEVVHSSGWDGSVSQVKTYLKANVKDPASLEFIEWSPVRKTPEGQFLVRAKYRARNSFGGYVVENNIFLLSRSGSVIAVSNAP